MHWPGQRHVSTPYVPTIGTQDACAHNKELSKHYHRIDLVIFSYRVCRYTFNSGTRWAVRIEFEILVRRPRCVTRPRPEAENMKILIVIIVLEDGDDCVYGLFVLVWNSDSVP